MKAALVCTYIYRRIDYTVNYYQSSSSVATINSRDEELPGWQDLRSASFHGSRVAINQLINYKSTTLIAREYVSEITI